MEIPRKRAAAVLQFNDNENDSKRIKIDSAQIVNTLKKHFGFQTTFRGRQEEVIIACLQGKDTYVQMSTGSGKSMCYQIPPLLQEGVCVVCQPLIALMQNQVSALKARGIKAGLLCSSTGKAESERILRDLARGPSIRLLYVTPEGLSTSKISQALKVLHMKKKLCLFAIDEAHCISEWGHCFRPHYRKLGRLKEVFPGIPIMALTATATKKVQEDIIESLGITPSIFTSSVNRSEILYEVRYKDLLPDGPFQDAVSFIKQHRDETGIVYCHRRNDCDSMAHSLKENNISVLSYHAGLSDRVREENQQKWINGQIKVIVATVAFGMGVDKADVRFVIHCTLPSSLEAFYQESGRAARDGRPAHSLLYYSDDDRHLKEFLLGKASEGPGPGPLGAAGKDKPYAASAQAKKDAFNKMVEFCTVTKCRRSVILEYFGEKSSSSSSGSRSCCDYCRNPHAVSQMVTTLTQLLSTTSFGRSRSRYGEDDFGENEGLLLGRDDAESGAEDEKSGAEDEEDEIDSEDEAATKAITNVRQHKGGDSSKVLAALERAEASHVKNKESSNSRSRLLGKVSSKQETRGFVMASKLPAGPRQGQGRGQGQGQREGQRGIQSSSGVDKGFVKASELRGSEGGHVVSSQVPAKSEPRAFNVNLFGSSSSRSAPSNPKSGSGSGSCGGNMSTQMEGKNASPSPIHNIGHDPYASKDSTSHLHSRTASNPSDLQRSDSRSGAAHHSNAKSSSSSLASPWQQKPIATTLDVATQLKSNLKHSAPLKLDQVKHRQESKPVKPVKFAKTFQTARNVTENSHATDVDVIALD